MTAVRLSYRAYKKNNPNGVDLKTFRDIYFRFNKFIVKKTLEGKEVTLPAGLGTVYIFGTKTKPKFDENGKVKGLAPDWVRTKKLWEGNLQAKQSKKLVYCTNEHTGGIRYKFFWSKNRVWVLNKNLYSFQLARINKRSIMNLVKRGKEYIIKK